MTSVRQKKKGYLLPDPVIGYPLICLSLMVPDHPFYRAAVRGAITELTKWWNWQKSYVPGDRRATQAAAMFRQTIYETMAFSEECFPETSGCKDHAPNSFIIEWNPNDPYRTPELVPAGYAFPPWYLATVATGITLGTSIGDVVTDIFRTQFAPVIPPASGYPRFRVHLNGTGVCELHLVKINGGGYAQITTDDDPLTVELLSLAKDVISVPPETSDDVIIEREITTPGTHHIDVLFIPLVNDELPVIGQGGALRKVVLCGFDEMNREIELRAIAIDENCDQWQWKYTDEPEDAWRNEGTPVCDGAPGETAPEAEFRLVQIDELCKQIETRLVGESEWTVLGTVCDGAPGDDGVCPECPPGPEIEPPDPDEGQDGACQVATAVTDWILDRYIAILTQFLEDVIGNGMSLLDFSDAALDLLGLANPITAVGNFFAWIASQQAQGALDNLNCAQDAGTRDALICHLYCLLPENGDLTAEIYTEWMAEINADTTIACRADITAFMASIPIAEVRTEAVAAVVFDIASDCSSCDCGCGSECYLVFGSHIADGVYQSASMAPQGAPFPHRVRFSACPGEPDSIPPGLFTVEVMDNPGGAQRLIRARENNCYMFVSSSGYTWNSNDIPPDPICASAFEFANDAPFQVTIKINDVLGGHS
jgi:hypothetical protein